MLGGERRMFGAGDGCVNGLYLFILTLAEARCVWKGVEDVWSW